jgi:hypothetical protein
MLIHRLGSRGEDRPVMARYQRYDLADAVGFERQWRQGRKEHVKNEHL